MICNAGMGGETNLREMPMEDYMRIFNVNFFCPVAMTKEALPHLEKTKGNIVHISSIIGNLMNSQRGLHK